MERGLAVMSDEMPDGNDPRLQLLIQGTDWHAVMQDINAAVASVNEIKASIAAWIIASITDAIDFIHSLTPSDILYGIAAVLIVCAYIQRHSRPRIDYRNERRRDF
jgi:hypothetical protein